MVLTRHNVIQVFLWFLPNFSEILGNPALRDQAVGFSTRSESMGHFDVACSLATAVTGYMFEDFELA
jgi:hypothetical protein